MADRIITVTNPSVVTNDTLAGYNNYSDQDGQLGTMMTPTEATNGHTVALSDGVVHQVTTKPVGTTNGEFSAVVSNAVTVNLSNSIEWDISLYSYASISGSLSPTVTSPRGMLFNNDGTRLYVPDYTNEEVYTFSVSVAYDISSTLTLINTMSMIQLASVTSICFSSDGMTFYSLQSANRIYQYDLSVSYDLSTAVYNTSNLPTTTAGQIWGGVVIGDMVFVAGTNGEIQRWDIQTPGNIASGTFTSTYDASAQISANVNGMGFNDDGTIMYLLDASDEVIYQYTLSVGYDLESTVAYAGKSLNTSPQDGNSGGFWFNGEMVIVTGITNDTLYQYNV